jgi:hypothetical protein
MFHGLGLAIEFIIAVRRQKAITTCLKFAWVEQNGTLSVKVRTSPYSPLLHPL